MAEPSVRLAAAVTTTVTATAAAVVNVADDAFCCFLLFVLADELAMAVALVHHWFVSNISKLITSTKSNTKTNRCQVLYMCGGCLTNFLSMKTSYKFVDSTADPSPIW
jgi:hypothetical protein